MRTSTGVYIIIAVTAVGLWLVIHLAVWPTGEPTTLKQLEAVQLKAAEREEYFEAAAITFVQAAIVSGDIEECTDVLAAWVNDRKEHVCKPCEREHNPPCDKLHVEGQHYFGLPFPLLVTNMPNLYLQEGEAE